MTTPAGTDTTDGLSATIAPSVNATVHAAAGTGKTWLLTSRIIRLLLHDVPPGAILAITFTRKAAGEIHQRIGRRLLDMAAADDEALAKMLREIHAPDDEDTRQKARGLYELLLSSEYGLRATTFHAFCQEILRRFPLEAGVPPGFDLLESTGELQAQAWRVLEQEITHDSDGEAARAMDVLLRECGNAGNAKRALTDFLEHRSDWWAYTEGEADPVAFAAGRLRGALDIHTGDNTVAERLSSPAFTTMLGRYATLLRRHPPQTSQDNAMRVERALGSGLPPDERLAWLRQGVLTAKGALRVMKASKALTDSLGAADAAELLDLHSRLGAEVAELNDRLLRRRTFELSLAWYLCGQRLLGHYQRLKLEQGVLDFDDLQWKTCELLNRSRHAQWVQYKLDQRIDHLLVDEFQDTNPTQWRLLLPLLEEMAAGDEERLRSVFIVGDVKQSVYRFRRAEPALFRTAHDWIERHMHARSATQHISWRSSPAIIEFVNMIFGESRDDSAGAPDDEGDYRLHDYVTHDTHHRERWGHAELLPLVPRGRGITGEERSTLRNPLLEPREVEEDERHRREGGMIATIISGLLGHAITDGGRERPLDYGDILILLRDRTHMQAYEDALRHTGIPYLSTGRRAFLDSLEARDIFHLLRTFIAPYDNLALASALRSPIFGCEDTDIVLLASQPEPQFWIERLKRIAPGLPEDGTLARACRLLQRWGDQADRIPVHDLLDRIYNEGNLIARYLGAVPPHLQSRVETNLVRLLTLALEVDGGRYPSLSRFLARLRDIDEDDIPGSGGIVGQNRRCVRVMTIHAVKGLESPVVFLANAARGAGGRDRGARALVEWPADEPRPAFFHLIGNKDSLDGASREILARQKRAEDREEANLLYVALTRAKQMLFVSGCEMGKGRGWYGCIERRLHMAGSSGQPAIPGLEVRHIAADDGLIFNTCGKIQYGDRGAAPATEGEEPRAAAAVDPALTIPFPDIPPDAIINPSRLVWNDGPDEATEGAGSGAKRRGIVIHRMLDVLSSGVDRAGAEEKLRHQTGNRLAPDIWNDCWEEACRVIGHPVFRDLYDPSRYSLARNELPVLYRHNGRDVYGVIDRLVLREQEILLIDYKTGGRAGGAALARAAEPYFEQMRLYAAGIRRLWPDNPLRALLLFTACRETVEVPLNE